MDQIGRKNATAKVEMRITDRFEHTAPLRAPSPSLGLRQPGPGPFPRATGRPPGADVAGAGAQHVHGRPRAHDGFVAAGALRFGPLAHAPVPARGDGPSEPRARLAAIEGDVLARLEAQSKRADEAEKLAEEAIEFSKTLRLERDEALQSLAAPTPPPAPAVSRNAEDWLGGKPPPAAPAPPPRVVQLPKPAAAAATPYMPAKDASPLRVCYEHEGEPGGETCVEPELQYTTKTNVRWIPAIASKPGWRFHHLIENGFAAPAVVPSRATRRPTVLYLPVCTPTPPPVANGPNKLVVLDEGDGAGFYPRVGEHDYLIYLKRSFVTKSDGVYTGTGRRYNRHYYPMAYSVADSYFHAELMGKAHPDVRGIAGDVNSGGRREINDGYFGAMRKSKIVVTCNPSHWEGDFRTFEALASGALIFVDEMYAFAEKLAYYLARPDEAAKIAAAGLKHALKYHRAVSRMDWVLRSAHEIKSYADADSHPYTHTARAIKHDVKATTQVPPVVDIGAPEFKNVKSVAPRKNVGRAVAPGKLSEDQIADLVKQNKVHRKQLGFRRMLRRRRRRR
ncbi:glycosyl transferase [Aureococcus anophagefferens]|nr:glycosyl transferase [Aureococcus anophagefferens]